MKGYDLALLEVAIFYLCAHVARLHLPQLSLLNPVMYYWFCFTVLTGFWEYIYVTNYDSIANRAEWLKENHDSVWNMDYSPSNVRPDLFARLFYAEYGANSDREYQSQRRSDYWSRLVESSHAFCCATFCGAALIACFIDRENAYRLGMVGMGMQFMNSLLYMGEYFLQCRDPDSPNFNTTDFPVGNWMMGRWFMWINVFWLLFPTVIIYLAC